MKPSLVLVSGLLSNEYIWKHQLTHLNDIASIQVFNPKEESSEEMVENILKNAPKRFALAGHSMGGWICLEVFRKAPMRISKLCLLNTSMRADSKERKAKRESMIKRCNEKKFKEIAHELAEFFISNPQNIKNTEQMFLNVGQNAFINQEKAMLNRNFCEDILSDINCPTLIVHATQDKNFSLEDHMHLVNKIPESKLAIVDDSGHMSPIEKPQVITTLLRFWLTYF